ncbi:MAG: hypothetical protein J2P37_02395 [Ktedonobacteraceae bacterium]|nr:hypothetical protein [Ktedonobacteraceae bacterium]MBO0790435.1 hypothetical protein [Ktedonobacteraceae bacterium]
MHVDRRCFVPYFYTRQGMEWRRQEAETSTVYQDRVLVTQIDEQQHASSSSPQPTIIAALLEALHLAPSLRVLEIGTGTGYNAALIVRSWIRLGRPGQDAYQVHVTPHGHYHFTLRAQKLSGADA